MIQFQKILKVFLAISFLFSSLTYAHSRVEFRLNKIHGLVVFAEAVLDLPTQAVGREDFQKFFKNHPEFNTKKIKSILENFKSADAALAPWFEFSNFPNQRSQGNWGARLLLIQSAYASTLDDLSTRISGLIPLSKHHDLIFSLKELMPYYEQFLWNPSLTRLTEYKKRYENLATHRIAIDSLVDQAAHFYHSEISKNEFFTVSLYPILGNINYIPGMAYGWVESVGVPVDRPLDLDLKADLSALGLSTIFHELCHSLSSSQSSEFQFQMEKWIRSENSSAAYGASYYLEEALAAALGNGGYVFEKLTGKLNSKDSGWYHNAYVSKLARALYPSVKQYFTQNKSIDQNFIHHTVEIFKDLFPSIELDVSHLFYKFMLATSSKIEDAEAISKSLYSEFDINSLRTAHLEELQIERDETLLLIAHPEDSEELLHLIKKYPELSPLLEKTTTTVPRIHWVRSHSGQTVFLIVAENTEQIVKLLKNLKDQKTLQSQ